MTNPHLEGPRCTRYAPSIKCASREEAQNDGSMYYSVTHNGWVFPADDRKPPRYMRKNLLAPFLWQVCPFCGGALPDAADIIEKILRPPPDDQEDGC